MATEPHPVCSDPGCFEHGIAASNRRQSEFYATHDRTIPARPDDEEEVEPDAGNVRRQMTGKDGVHSETAECAPFGCTPVEPDAGDVEALTEAERREIAWTFHGAQWLSPERAECIGRIVAARVAAARAEGAAEALTDAARDWRTRPATAGTEDWLRDRAARIARGSRLSAEPDVEALWQAVYEAEDDYRSAVQRPQALLDEARVRETRAARDAARTALLAATPTASADDCCHVRLDWCSRCEKYTPTTDGACAACKDT